MVLVDIYVPSVDKTYNFSLNEKIGISAVIAEITEMVEQKEKFVFNGDKNKLNLYSQDTQTPLSKDNTLIENQIGNGSHLILV